MKSKTIKIAIVLFLSSVIVSNIPPIRYIISYVIDFSHDRYSNASGTFTYIDMAGNKPEDEINRFNSFVKETSPTPEESILYRIFYRNPFAFWRYYSYGYEKYDIPYKSWSSIKKARAQHTAIKSLDKHYIEF